MKLFAKISNSFQTLTLSAKSSILDVWQGSEYSSEFQVSNTAVDDFGNFLPGLKWERYLKSVNNSYSNKILFCSNKLLDFTKENEFYLQWKFKVIRMTKFEFQRK